MPILRGGERCDRLGRVGESFGWMEAPTRRRTHGAGPHASDGASFAFCRHGQRACRAGLRRDTVPRATRRSRSLPSVPPALRDDPSRCASSCRLFFLLLAGSSRSLVLLELLTAVSRVQVWQLQHPPARSAQCPLRGLHRARRRRQRQPTPHEREPQPLWRRRRRLWLWLPEQQRPRQRPGTTERRLPVRHAQPQGPVQRRGAQRAREPKRPADRGHPRQGPRIKRRRLDPVCAAARQQEQQQRADSFLPSR